MVQRSLPLIPDSHLYPVIAIKRAFSFVFNAPQHSQAFIWLDPASLCFRSFTYSQFLRRFRDILRGLRLPGAPFSQIRICQCHCQDYSYLPLRYHNFFCHFSVHILDLVYFSCVLDMSCQLFPSILFQLLISNKGCHVSQTMPGL